MSKRSEIEIEISENGDKVNFHIKGIKGKGCVDAVEFLEKGLGIITEKKLTQEYYEVPEKKVVNVGFNKTK